MEAGTRCSLDVFAQVEVLRSLPLGGDPVRGRGLWQQQQQQFTRGHHTILGSACWWLCCLLLLAVAAWRRARGVRLLSSLRWKSCALSLSVVTPCEDGGSGSGSSSSSFEATTPYLAVRVGGSAACSYWRWRHGGGHVVFARCPRSGRSLALSPSRW